MPTLRGDKPLSVASMPPIRPRKLKNNANPKHRWTDEDRITLAILHKFYEISSGETATILNSIIGDCLVREGFQDGLTTAAIAAQVQDMRNSDRGRVFQQVQLMDFGKACNTYRAQRELIETTAQELCITLKPRLPAIQPSKEPRLKRGLVATSDEWSSNSYMGPVHSNSTALGNSTKKGRPNKTRSQTITTVARRKHFRRESTAYTTLTSSLSSSLSLDSCSTGSWNSEENSSENEAFPGLDEDDFPETAKRIRPILSLDFDNRGRAMRRHPRLVFRAYEPDHGLWARAFQDSTAIVSGPPNDDGDEFRNLAHRHLIQDRSFNSPFLSFTQSPRRALTHHTAKGAQHGSLAIIDYNVLEQDMRDRYGKDTRLWWVNDLCKRFEWDDLAKVDNNHPRCQKLGARGGYTGTGEVRSSENILLICASLTTEAVSYLGRRLMRTYRDPRS